MNFFKANVLQFSKSKDLLTKVVYSYDRQKYAFSCFLNIALPGKLPILLDSLPKDIFDDFVYQT